MMVQIKFCYDWPTHRVAEIFKFENVYTQTDTQTTARLVYYKLTFEPSAQVSYYNKACEHNIKQNIEQWQHLTVLSNLLLGSDHLFFYCYN